VATVGAAGVRCWRRFGFVGGGGADHEVIFGNFGFWIGGDIADCRLPIADLQEWAIGIWRMQN
jgi:hypothetical protein